MKNFSVKTKENFRRNSKEPGRKKYILWVFAALCVLFIAKGMVSTMTSGATDVLYSIRHYMFTSSATIPVFVRSRTELLNHIQSLEQEVASQRGLDATLAYVMGENTELRALLNASSSPRTVAGVLARPPYTPYDTIVLDKGSVDGILPHAPVYHGKGIAIGYVHAVFPHMSYVTLFSSPGVESTVYIFGSNLFTTAYGEGSGVVRLSVPQGIPLEKGSAVVLPALDTGALGTIDEIQSIPTEPEQHAYVTLGAPLQSIRLVSVGAVPITPTSFDAALTRIDEEEKRLFMVPVPEDERLRTEATTTSTANTGSTTSTSTIP
jgi:cell shape-determining protein MreC